MSDVTAASIDALTEAFDAAVVAASAAARAAELLAGTAPGLAGPITEAADATAEAEARLGWELWLHTADPEYADFADYGETLTATKENA